MLTDALISDPNHHAFYVPGQIFMVTFSAAGTVPPDGEQPTDARWANIDAYELKVSDPSVATCNQQHWLGDPVEHVFDFDVECTAAQPGSVTFEVNYYDGNEKRAVSDTVTVTAR